MKPWFHAVTNLSGICNDVKYKKVTLSSLFPGLILDHIDYGDMDYILLLRRGTPKRIGRGKIYANQDNDL
ncbi:hypothetical protein [Echinicola shivajiensis]|uniref:hypothetical protein n=1 Tax=Echinicola shivajiensis TaxID=1035916 RepID=UPI001BFC33B4|nr:hypothetical protein [Echinicola shivajiensis]